MWEAYDKAEPGLRDYIMQREAQMSDGIRPLQDQIAAARPLQEAIKPYLPVMQQYGISPEQWISALGNAHHTLTFGSPQEKAAAFQRMAQQYGVPLDGLASGAQAPQADPQVQWLQQQVQHLNQSWQRLQQDQAQQQQAGMMQTIEQFAADPEHNHFSAVRETMAGLLQAGLAQDLQTAYDKAIRMHDDVWQQVQTAKAATEAAERDKQQAEVAAKAKAHAVSPRTSSPSGNGAAKPTDRRASLAEAMDRFESRV